MVLKPLFTIHCDHIQDLKPYDLEQWGFVVESPVSKKLLDIDPEWKFCPVCGKECC